jgi:23S rRNA pseudouridine2605 synthase
MEKDKRRKTDKPRKTHPIKSGEELTRLNKYIANAGVCSRREADNLITAGAIRVNGKVVTELGTKISRKDKVQYGDELIRPEKNVYVLLNKPKGYITTVDDPYHRNTVMTLIRGAAKERIYPVGRLDRNTTGLLLFTNDGELTKKLTHPSHRIEKIYHVTLDRNLLKNDMDKVAGGITLEDGIIKVDEIAYVEEKGKKEIGIRLHSGKNRIIRRVFESLGYKVIKLDRVIFAGLTKKEIPRGKWRHLKEKEIDRLRMLRKK